MEKTKENPLSNTQLNDSNPLKQWFDSLEDYEQRYWINRIALVCDVSTVTVYCWRNGTRTLRKVYAEKINQLVGKDIIPLS